MKIRSLSCLYFSPTGTSKKIMDAVVQGMQAEDVKMVDCTHAALRKNVPSSLFQCGYGPACRSHPVTKGTSVIFNLNLSCCGPGR
jgi:hypothetical protein